MGVVLAAVGLAAGCTGGASPSPADAGPATSASASATVASHAPTAGPTTSLAPTPSASSTAAPSGPVPSPTDAATRAPIPAQPPVATLRGLSGATVAGKLGSYTWGSEGSDAPWVVGPVLGTSAVGASLGVSLADATPASWTAAWAEVSGAIAGDPADGFSGTGPVAVRAPATPGDWSLAVTVTFSPGHNAAYFWHLAITR